VKRGGGDGDDRGEEIAGRLADIAPPLLAWFDRHARDLPWRRRTSPYRTLVSELMLQQTLVATVVPYFEAFVARWPELAALARAQEDEVLTAWSGLGYYSRARNLHRAARAVVERHEGALPDDEEALRALPGIGPYTAAAIAAIAFGKRTFALDGNAARVVARLGGVRDAIDEPATRARLRALGKGAVPQRRAGAFAEAVMELGATVCTPRAPRCDHCPVVAACEARRAGTVSAIPVKAPPRPKRAVRVVSARARRGDRVLLVRRRRGLLAGTWGLPTIERPRAETSKRAADQATSTGGAMLALSALRSAGVRARAATFAGEVRHVFTHRDLVAEVYDVSVANLANMPTMGGPRASAGGDPDLCWATDADLETLAVSSLLEKLLAVGVAPGAERRPPKPRRAPSKRDKAARGP
jgi:A/G-specific adenine glycosylase